MYRARYRRIVFFFARLLLSVVFWQLFLPRIGLSSLSNRNKSGRIKKSARDFRILATSMGGVLIKVGQFMSSRVDVLPFEFTSELEGLQDEVPAVEFADLRKVAEDEFGASLEEKFLAFNPQPLAAASLGQVHLARIELSNLNNQNQFDTKGQAYNVVVKIQRPQIEKIIATDLAALRTVARWLQHYKPIRKRADVHQLLDEFTTILYQEIDYLAEGRNAETFSHNFSDYPGVRVPKVFWSHTTRRVLTLENVLAIKITDYQAVTLANIDRAEVASRLLDTYLKQIFEDGFFHADPHPGNLFIQPGSRNIGEGIPYDTDWFLTFVDFGMVGYVPDKLRQGLRELLIAVGTQDSSKVIKAYMMMDVLLPTADLDSIEKASAKVFDKFWGKNMSELTAVKLDEIKELADEFRDLIFSLPFQVPQNIIFLARAVGILSGMCTGLDPNFNVWDHLAPYARKLIANEARTDLSNLWSIIERQLRAMAFLPGKVEDLILKIDSGEISVRTPQLSQQMVKLEKAIRLLTMSVFVSVFLLISSYLFVNDQVLLSTGALAFSVLIFVWGLFSVNKK